MTLLENNDNLNFYQILDVPESATLNKLKNLIEHLVLNIIQIKQG